MSFADGINIDRARSLIASARTGTIGRPVISTRDWIRSEAEARLLRIFWSPLVGEGLCECVDVGARTTDASFIRIRERHEDKTRVKDALGFYSARSHPPPMDALGECLATIEDHGISPALLRTRLSNNAHWRSSNVSGLFPKRSTKPTDSPVLMRTRGRSPRAPGTDMDSLYLAEEARSM